MGINEFGEFVREKKLTENPEIKFLQIYEDLKNVNVINNEDEKERVNSKIESLKSLAKNNNLTEVTNPDTDEKIVVQNFLDKTQKLVESFQSE